MIDGQKMFTTNAHLCDYVFLLARTDPASERHRGLTTFLVPLEPKGFEAQGVFTVSGERTNITFYNELFLEDRWRISEVGAGWQSLMLALQDEHSAAFSPHLDRLLAATEAGRRDRDGRLRSPGPRGCPTGPDPGARPTSRWRSCSRSAPAYMESVGEVRWPRGR